MFISSFNRQKQILFALLYLLYEICMTAIDEMFNSSIRDTSVLLTEAVYNTDIDARSAYLITTSLFNIYIHEDICCVLHFSMA